MITTRTSIAIAPATQQARCARSTDSRQRCPGAGIAEFGEFSRSSRESGRRIAWRALALVLLLAATARVGTTPIALATAAAVIDSPSGGDAVISNSANGVTRPVATSRELLALFGVGPEQLNAFVDDRIAGTEASDILPLLYAARRSPLVDVERLAHPQGALTELMEDPAAARGMIVRVEGFVRRVERLVPDEAARRRFELDAYFRSEMLVKNPPRVVVVYSAFVPEAWKKGEPIDERASVYGFFAGRAVLREPTENRNDDERDVAVLVARRVASHPATPLGDLGMDVGLFDDVSNRTRLSAEERECFYQLLAALKRADTAELVHRKRGDTDDVAPLFNEPDAQKGRLVALEGTAKRAIEVLVDDPEVTRRFGFDRYYEVEIFTDDSQSNPIVFCVLNLPADMPRGEDITANVRIVGFFLKAWAYPRGGGGGESRELQVAPLLIARELGYRPLAASDSTGWIVGGLFIAGLVAVSWLMWRSARRDTQVGRRMFERKYRPGEDVELGDLDLS